MSVRHLGNASLELNSCSSVGIVVVVVVYLLLLLLCFCPRLIYNETEGVQVTVT